jgi:lysophospholipase L1-like esterase
MFKYLILTILSVFLLELGIRFTGKLETYSEKNFDYYLNHYESPSSLLNQSLGLPNSIFSAPQQEFNHNYTLDSFGLLGFVNRNICSFQNTVCFFGDSFVFGVGASKSENMVSRLQELDGVNCYYNAGIPGSDPFYQERLYKNKFRGNGYNNVILALNASDLMDYVFRGGTERFDSNKTTEEPWFHFFYQYSHIVRAFLHGVLRRDYSLLSQKELIQRKGEAVKAYLRLLKELKTEIKDNHNGNFLVVTHPYPTNFQHKKSSLEKEVFNYSYLEDLCLQLNENGIPCADLFSEFNEVLTEENYLDYSWPIDGHFNAKGYKLYADILANSTKFKEFLAQINE